MNPCNWYTVVWFDKTLGIKVSKSNLNHEQAIALEKKINNFKAYYANARIKIN